MLSAMTLRHLVLTPQIREQMSGPDIHVFALKFLAMSLLYPYLTQNKAIFVWIWQMINQAVPFCVLYLL